MANGSQIRYGISFNVDKTGLNQLKTELQQIKNMTVGDLVKLNPSIANNAVNELEKIKGSANKLENALEKAFNPNLGTLNVTKFNQELKKLNINQIYKDLSQAGVAGQKAFRDVTTQILTTNMHLKQTHTLLDSMAETMGNTIKWGIASSALNSFTGSIQKAYGYVKNLDTSLNNIRIVTEKTADEMGRFAVKANNAAKALGQSTTSYTDAALIYYQQGLGEEEVISRAETTLKAANVTGQAAAEVSEQLTAVWNGFQVGAEDTELYVDKLAAVAATTASDLEELSTGMSKVASAANAMGVDIDQLNGHLATVISVTRQAPESVGTAFKTIYARLGDLAVGGEDEFGVSLGDVSGKLKQMGIEILDQQGNMRDMGTVIEEVAEKWNGWTEAQRQAAAVAMAGKRQYNNLIALFDNWDMYTDAVNTSKNAIGTLQNQQDIYMESTAAHLEKMGAAAEDLYDSLLDPKGINVVIDGLTLLLELSSNFVDSIGGAKVVLLGLGSVGARVFSKQIASSLSVTIANIIGLRENLQKLNAEQEILNQFQGINIEDEKTKELIKMKEKILSISKSITEEERNTANEHIKQHKLLQDQEETLNQNLKAAEELQIRLAGETKANIETSEGREVLKQELIVEQNYFKANNDFNVTEAQNHFQNIVALEKSAQKTKDLSQAKKDYVKTMSDQAKIAEELVALDQLDDKNKAKLQIALDKYNASLNKKGKISINDKKGMAAARELQLAYKNAVEDTNKQIENSIKNLNRYDEAMKNTKESIDGSKTSFESWLKQLQIKDKINNFVNLAGAFGQAASSIQAISQIGSIWNNEDLTGGEKFLQTVTNLGFALPMLTASLTNINKMFGLETTVKGAAVAANEAYLASLIKINAARLMEIGTIQQQSAAQLILAEFEAGDITATATLTRLKQQLAMANMEVAGGVTAATMAIKRFLSALGPIGWIFMAVGAVSALTAAFDKWGKKTLTTEKQLENQKQALDAVKKSYDRINQSLEAYNDATAAMDKATKGTKEWNDALQEANNTLLDLIEKYPQLAEYVKMGDNGQLYIADEDALLEAQNKVMNAAQRAYYLSQANAQESLGKQQQSRLANGITLTDSYSPTGTGQASTLSKSELQLILDKIETNGVGFLKDKESFKAIMGDSLDDSIIDKVLLEENKDAIIELSNQLELNSQATELYTEQIADSFLRERGISNTGPLKGLYGEELNRVRDEEYEKLKQQSNGDIREAYKTLIGATEVRDEDGEIQYKIGDEWTAIEDDAARMALAMERAGEATQDYANDLATASEGMRGSDNYKEALLSFGATGEDGKPGEADLSYLSTKELEDLENISDEQITNLANVFELSGDDLREKIKQGLLTERTKRDEETTRQIGEASGDFNKYLDELVSGGYMSSTQKGSFKTEEWLGQVDKSLLQDAAARGISVEDILTEVDMSQIINADNVGEAFKNAVSAGAEKLIQDQIAKEKIAQIVQEGVSQGLEKEEMEEYATHLMEVAESSEILSDDLKDNEEAANRVARATMRMNKGMDAIVENFENWADILRNSDEASEEYADAMSDLRDAISDVLDIDDPGMLSHEFLSSAETLNLLEQAANGSEEALEELQVAAGRDIIANIELAPEINEEEILSKYDEMMALMPDLKVGAELDDGAFLDALNELILSSGMTADEVNALLGTMRLDAEFNTTPVKQWQTVPTFRIERKPVGLFAWEETSYQVDSKKYETTIDVPSIGVNGEPPITKITRTSAPSLGNHSSTNAGGKKSSGGGSSKPKKQDRIDEEIDRYHDINIEIENLSREMDRLGEIQDKLFGKSLLENLNKQLKVIEKQKDATEEKLRIAKEEQAELKATLAAQGVEFGRDGLISNYMTILYQKQAEYNKLVDKYNKMSADGQENFEDTLNIAKEELELLNDNIERYDELTVKEIPDLADDLTDLAYQEIEIRLEKFNLEAEVKLDLREAIRDWADFEREIVKGLEETDYVGYAQSQLQELQDLLATGTAETLTQNLNSIIEEVKAYNTDPENYRGMFAAESANGTWVVDENAMMEQLKKDQSSLMDYLTDLRDKQEEINQAYLDNIDKIDEAYQELSDTYSFIDDQLNHSLNVIKLIKGEEVYEDMAHFYEQQKLTNEALLASQVQQRDYYKSMMDKETDPEAIKKWEELWKQSVQNVNATVEKLLEGINAEYQNTVLKALKEIDDALGGTRKLRAEWDVAIGQDNRYLDGVNKAYNIQSLENKFNESINNTDSIAAQRALNKLKDEELKKLQEKDKLTQYDVDRANQLLDIEMKRIALEEAQKNKSKMRLRRDSSGNYSYQFVADEETQAQAQQELMDAQNSLYNMDKEQLRKNQEELFTVWQEYQDLMIEYSQLTLEERKAREEEFSIKFADYQQQMKNIAAGTEWVRLNLAQSTYDSLDLMYEEDGIKFADLNAEKQRQLVEELGPTFTATIDTMIDAINNSESGYEAAWLKADEQIALANEKVEASLAKIESTLGLTDEEGLRNITSSYYTEAIDLAGQMIEKQKENINKYKEEQTELIKVKGALEQVTAAWGGTYNASIKALETSQAYIESIYKQKAAIEAQTEAEARQRAAAASYQKIAETTINKKPSRGDNPITPTAGKNQLETKGSNPPQIGETPPHKGELRAAYIKNLNLHGASVYAKNGTKKVEGKVVAEVDNVKKYYRIQGSNTWFKYKTGGLADFTGPAWLDGTKSKPELILNAKDTENMLSMLEIVRNAMTVSNAKNNNISDTQIEAFLTQIGESINDIAISIMDKFNRIENITKDIIKNQVSNEDFKQNVEIHANFPDATNAEEIQKAFNNLVNMASQRAYSTKR